ncbi:MAG: hypothetical protein ACREBB_01605, partial [Nitrosotalea sp.]
QQQRPQQQRPQQQRPQQQRPQQQRPQQQRPQQQRPQQQRLVPQVNKQKSNITIPKLASQNHEQKSSDGAVAQKTMKKIRKPRQTNAPTIPKTEAKKLISKE